jgi:hypothetical protein
LIRGALQANGPRWQRLDDKNVMPAMKKNSIAMRVRVVSI